MGARNSRHVLARYPKDSGADRAETVAQEPDGMTPITRCLDGP